jgi:hypothetical protein
LFAKPLLNAKITNKTMTYIKPSASNQYLIGIKQRDQVGNTLYTAFAQPLHSLCTAALVAAYQSRTMQAGEVTNQWVINLIFVGHYRNRWHSDFESANIITLRQSF